MTSHVRPRPAFELVVPRAREEEQLTVQTYEPRPDRRGRAIDARLEQLILLGTALPHEWKGKVRCELASRRKARITADEVEPQACLICN